MNPGCTRLIASLLLFFCISCKKGDGPKPAGPVFDTIPQSWPLQPMLAEISGMSYSHANPGFLWAHEDSGTPSHLYLLGQDGVVVRTVVLEGITNRDWEDMALAGNEIYLAETGDNSLAHSNYSIYKFQEPAGVDTVHQVDVINFTYPDGPHDAEAILVDSASGDVYIITKRDVPSRLYKLSYPFAAAEIASLEGSLPYTGVVGAALSADGKEVLLKTYTAIYYYNRKPGQSILQALAGGHVSLSYQLEPQGEALCFARDGSGYYTLSEKGFASFVNLNFYRRR